MLALRSHTPYDVLVAVHVTAAVVGFGAVALSGVYGGSATRPERDGAWEELRRYFALPGRAELLVTVVPFPGVAALLVDPGPSRLGQTWVAVGLGLWVIASALLLAVVRPAGAVISREMASGGGGSHAADVASSGRAARVRQAGSRLRWSAAASDLLFCVALVVMVIQPGS